MDGDGMFRRILDKLGPGAGDFVARLGALPPSDLTTLLLSVYKVELADVHPPELLRRYRQNPFVSPAALPQCEMLSLEHRLVSMGEDHGFRGILLSPAALLGGASVMAQVDQNNAVSATRGLEILSDPTNAMALLAAAEREKNPGSPEINHLCTSHRVLRAQRFHAPGYTQHFTVFCLFSAGRDTGSYAFEKAAFASQLACYRGIFRTLMDADISVTVRRRGGYPDGDGLFRALESHLATALPGVAFSFERDESVNTYYQGVQFTVYAHLENDILNIGDGGFVDWTAALLSNGKQRALTSAVGVDRILAALMARGV